MPDQTNTKKDRPLAFWDIESLANVFMFAMYFPKSEFLSGQTPDPNDWLLFFCLADNLKIDEAAIRDRVFAKNPQLDPSRTEFRILDLKDPAANRLLLNWFSVDGKRAFGKPEENEFRKENPVIRTDLDDSTAFPYLVGYNSFNYDCTMMAAYFNETWGISGSGVAFSATTADAMRRVNNLLFTDAYRDRMKDALGDRERCIYENMLRAGLLIDAAKVNDKVYKMPLKRIMGMMGMDIFEDELVRGDDPVTSANDLCDLFAYNASDVVKLSVLFSHPAYMAQFELKKNLLTAYPDIVYKDENGIRSVRVNRLRADDTSAKFAQRVLCPDGYLTDIRAVSFEYPKNSGRNVLAETRAWAAEKFKDHPDVLEDYLNPIFDWYGNIEGRNYDGSDHYLDAWGFDALPVEKIADLPQPCTCVPYFNVDGTPAETYVNFGIGGIHGAEYDKARYGADLAAYEKAYAKIKHFADSFTDDEIRALKPTFEMDGEKRKRSEYVTLRKDGSFSVKWPKKPELFEKSPKGIWNLNKKYATTSDDEVDHEDFTSYYPGLLMQLKAYENPALGEDRYVQQFENKTLYGKYMKDKSRPESERTFYRTMREGTKLILNSASGASDTEFDNPIRMNNVIITMRLIGQLFTWRIGQAQTLAGYKITSTNTDGLYAVCDASTRDRCRAILASEAANIGVGIEPEAMRLISKDANNRIEVSPDGKLLSASGGDTACCGGPVPNKALSHPALIDRLLVDYLIKYGVEEPFDEDRAIAVLDAVKAELSPFELLMLYQQIINSSEGSVRYIFAVVDGKTRTFQNNNRIFAIRKPGARLWMANGWNGSTGRDSLADEVLRAYGVDPSNFTCTRVMKISRIDPEQDMFIYNRSLQELPEPVAKDLIDNLDDGYYIDMLRAAYANWCNAVPEKE